MKPIVFSAHARQRAADRGAPLELVERAIREGAREPAQRGLQLYRLNVQFRRRWGGRRYAVQQIAPVVAEEENRLVVVTVFTFYFQEEVEP